MSQTQWQKRIVSSGQRQLAVRSLLLADGAELQNQLLTIDAEGRVIAYAPLTAEVPFCEWFRGTWKL